ncbi:hypothetical protein ACQKNS_17560 [Peribacillus sp. NPDC094092]|uniref:hypothetical protein n=1 Tax=Peribacillus sp. NPDC094092 TaxID=3390611 RepID=UPI003D026C7F
MSSVKAGMVVLTFFRFHFKFQCRLFDIYMTSACSLVAAVTSSAPADAYSAIAATSWGCLDPTLCMDGQQA